MGSMSIWHWLIVLAVVMVVFGTKKIGNIGPDLGKAVKGFKDAMKSEEEKAAGAQKVVDKTSGTASGTTIDVDAKEKSKL